MKFYSNDHSINLDIEQQTVLPINDDFNLDAQDAINYLKNVREEAKYINKNHVSCDTSLDLNNSIQNLHYYDYFDKLINYSISKELLNIRNDPFYIKRKEDTLKYIHSLKEKIQHLTQILQTDQIISISDWENILISREKPSIHIGQWNSYNWCNLLEYFSNLIHEDLLFSILDTYHIHWIILSLISLNTIDSFNPHVSYCMQNIRRYLETKNFILLEKSDYYRIESIVIIIKYVYNQY